MNRIVGEEELKNLLSLSAKAVDGMRKSGLRFFQAEETGGSDGRIYLVEDVVEFVKTNVELYKKQEPAATLKGGRRSRKRG